MAKPRKKLAEVLGKLHAATAQGKPAVNNSQLKAIGQRKTCRPRLNLFQLHRPSLRHTRQF